MNDPESPLQQIFERYDRSPEYVASNLSLYAHRRDLSRLLCHYDLFRKTVDLPGRIVECGVFNGGTLMLWAKLLDIFCMGDTSKKVIGFDTFSGFPEITKEDLGTVEIADKREGGYHPGTAESELIDLIGLLDQDRFAPEFPRVELVKGDIRQTAAEYVDSNREMRISLLNLDLDLYEPTLAALKEFFPLVVPGGVVILDDYGLEGWSGATAAVEYYFGKDLPKISKFNFRAAPGGYFIK